MDKLLPKSECRFHLDGMTLRELLIMVLMYFILFKRLYRLSLHLHNQSGVLSYHKKETELSVFDYVENYNNSDWILYFTSTILKVTRTTYLFHAFKYLKYTLTKLEK